ncbi:MAG: MBL fold metallo-hydrolase [Flavobacteriales bacterium]|nr:MBL fold metallo-hydrolase [Flavobacteriales bacterium]
MKLNFWGAAKQVTGSMHQLVLKSGYNVLIDCGLQYERGDSLEVNHDLPVNPKEVDLILLTHAHIDHSGNIPTFIKKGYDGNIICTEPTYALAESLLSDSVNVQLAESKPGKNKRKWVRHTSVLYGQKDVNHAMNKTLTYPFLKWFEVNEELRFMFYPAGHILGAASILLEIRERNTITRIGFTGDLGQINAKIVVDPMPMPELDYLVSESTYGNRLHKNEFSPEEELERYIQKNCINIRGRIVIPAFSVGRTQAILFTLNKLYRKGILKGIRVFTDSKLGIQSTKIHAAYDSYLNEEAKKFIEEYGSLFEFPELRVIQTESEQKEMAYHSGPSIIVSSAGMIEGGRIQQHIRNNIQNPMCTILIAGYCAKGTLGYRLLQGQNSVKIKNKEHAVFAKIRSTDVFSAHPDRTGLVDYIKNSESGKLKKIFLVHGEAQNMTEFGEFLGEQINTEIVIPEKGMSFEI